MSNDNMALDSPMLHLDLYVMPSWIKIVVNRGILATFKTCAKTSKIENTSCPSFVSHCEMKKEARIQPLLETKT